MPDLRNRFVAFPVTSRGLISNTVCCVIIANSFFTWVRFLYAPLLYLAYFTRLIIAYVSNISAYFTIMVLRPSILYGNKPGNYSCFFSRCCLRRWMRKESGEDTPHPGKGLRPQHSKLGIP